MSDFLFIGNALWLDFVNTEIVFEGRPVDLLSSGADLRAWLSEAGIGGQTTDGDAVRLLPRARELRALLRTLADTLAREAAVSDETVQVINHLLARQKPQLVREGDKWRQEWSIKDGSANAALVPIAQSAADLLTQGETEFVRKCEGPTCVLYFYDISKNHKRRWCRMTGCGNRRKAAAHYRRSRQAEAA